jgi:2-methylcitrate dehydratase PrpD
MEPNRISTTKREAVMAVEKKAAGMTAALAAYVAQTTFDDLPPSALEHAKLAILDTVACAVAASRFDVGRIVIDHARQLEGDGPATVWSPGFRTSAPTAAYVNGHLSNALDYDLNLHLDTHVLPAAFALAEQLHVDGRTFFEAYIPAREVGARLMKALDGRRSEGLGVSHRGWWHAGLVGPMDAALVSARLLGLDEEATARSMGIASSSVGGFRRSLGTMTKSLHSGKGARDGVHAAMLAGKGFTGDPEILEAPMGLIEALCPDGDFGYEELSRGLGSEYELESPPQVKPYPTCGPSQAQIDSVLALLDEEIIDPTDIDRLVVNFHPHSLFRPEARDEIEAGFSTPYIIAVTLIDGGFGLEQLSPNRVNDTRVRELMSRIEHDPEAPDRQVTVWLRDGRQLVSDCGRRRTLGTWDEIAEKFDSCVQTRITPTAAEEFKSAVRGLEHIDDIATVLGILSGGAMKGLPSSP